MVLLCSFASALITHSGDIYVNQTVYSYNVTQNLTNNITTYNNTNITVINNLTNNISTNVTVDGYLNLTGQQVGFNFLAFNVCEDSDYYPWRYLANGSWDCAGDTDTNTQYMGAGNASSLVASNSYWTSDNKTSYNNWTQAMIANMIVNDTNYVSDTNFTSTARTAINSTLGIYNITVNCSNVYFGTTLGSAGICDGTDDGGAGGGNTTSEIGIASALQNGNWTLDKPNYATSQWVNSNYWGSCNNVSVCGYLDCYGVPACETDPQVDAISEAYVCQGGPAGAHVDCDILKDISGDCVSGSVCMGGIKQGNNSDEIAAVSWIRWNNASTAVASKSYITNTNSSGLVSFLTNINASGYIGGVSYIVMGNVTNIISDYSLFDLANVSTGIAAYQYMSLANRTTVIAANSYWTQANKTSYNNYTDASIQTIAGNTAPNATAGNLITITGLSVAHTDTSTQANVSQVNSNYVQNLTFDMAGHVTAVQSRDMFAQINVTSGFNLTNMSANRINVSCMNVAGLMVGSCG